ncbi:MAG: YggS family pyridoxal phosphate-dependent enzyme [Mobilitalea sp.]
MMKENILEIEQRIQRACERAGRDRSEVTLIAVSKTMPNEKLVEAYHLGMRAFGENKVQELVQKYEALSDKFDNAAEWHMIGHLQRNKVKYIVDKAELIHSVDSVRLAEQINLEATKKDIVCDILIEVNISDEDTKYGVSPAEVSALLEEVVMFKNIRVRGLMTVAPYTDNPEKNREYFKKLRQLYVDIKSKNNDNNCNGSNIEETAPRYDLNNFNVLSMGMTGDFEIAIEEGATIIRVGTGIFGERDYSKS